MPNEESAGPRSGITESMTARLSAVRPWPLVRAHRAGRGNGVVTVADRSFTYNHHPAGTAFTCTRQSPMIRKQRFRRTSVPGVERMANTLSFHVVEIEGGALSVIPCIDGKPLSSMIAEYEAANGYTDTVASCQTSSTPAPCCHTSALKLAAQARAIRTKKSTCWAANAAKLAAGH
jgi:hypothetical protein